MRSFPRLLAAISLLSLASACHGSVELAASGTTSGSGGGASSGAGGASSSGDGGGGTGGWHSCPAPCDLPWSASFGTPSEKTTAVIGSVAALPDGGALVPYLHTKSTTGGGQARLRRYDAHGAVLWDVLAFDSAKVAPDGTGHMVVAGTILKGTTQVGGATLSCASDSCLAVGKIDDTGSFVWAKTWDRAAAPESMAASPGGIVLTGWVDTGVDFGDPTIAASKGSWLVKLTPSGDLAWLSRLASAGADKCTLQAYRVAISAGGTVSATGKACWDADLAVGDFDVPPDPPSKSGGWAFLVVLDAAGKPTWSKNIGPNAWASMAFAPDGSALFASNITGTVDLGGGLVGAPGQHTLVVTRISPDGTHLWSQPVAITGGAIAAGPQDRVVVTGQFSQSFTFAGTTLTSAGLLDAALLSLDGAGNPLAARSFGTSEDDGFSGLSLTALGDPVVIGPLAMGGIDFGQGPLARVGLTDLFVAKIIF